MSLSHCGSGLVDGNLTNSKHAMICDALTTDDPHSMTHQSEGDSRVRKGMAGDEALLDRRDASLCFDVVHLHLHVCALNIQYINFPAHCSGRCAYKL